MELEARKRVQKSKPRVKKVAELTHFKRDKLLRIICDASKQTRLRSGTQAKRK